MRWREIEIAARQTSGGVLWSSAQPRGNAIGSRSSADIAPRAAKILGHEWRNDFPAVSNVRLSEIEVSDGISAPSHAQPMPTPRPLVLFAFTESLKKATTK
jgi:hypothetical protein